MAIIYTYPKVTPALGDLVVITDVSDSNKTKQTTIQDIKDVIDVVDSLTAGPGISLSASTGDITISNTGVLSVDTTNGSFIDLTPVAPTTGNVVITADLSATGTADATTFLRGDNAWTPISSLSFEIDGLNASATATTYTISPGSEITLKSTGTSISEGAASNIAGVVARLDNVDPDPNTIFVGLRGNGGSPSSTTFYRGDGVWAPATSSGTTEVVETVRNTSGVTINKGVALHITGNTAGTPDVTYATSDGNYPASGLALSDIPNNSTGQMILLGVIDTLDTTAVAGTGGLGDTIYIKEAPGVIPNPFTISDSLTFDPPTGGVHSTPENKLQNVGILIRDNATQGEIQVTAGGRVAATPNLTQGSLFVGNSSNQSSELAIGSAGQILTVSGSDAVWAAAPAGYTNWILSGDSGANQDIDSGNTVNIAGGTDVETAASATDTLTVNHSAVSRADTTSTASPAFGGTFDVIDTATSSTQGHLTAVNLKTITLPDNPAQPSVAWNNQLALIGAEQAGTTTTGARVLWAQGTFTSNTANYKLIDNYCYLEFDLQFTSVGGFPTAPTPISQYMLVNLPFNVAATANNEQGFGIVTESTGSFAGHTLVTTNIPLEPPIDITEYQDPKRGDRGVVNYWSQPPATLIPSTGVLPAWVIDTLNGSKTNYMCFTYPNFFVGNIELTPHYALRGNTGARLRGNIIYRVIDEPVTITPPDDNYVGG